ncbi:MarR family transcriptional regulator [Sporosarcina sp. G11-34]|uniref:MarR family transcriptional regulator n=1 Tax=Sporosarcina sp. G11-34 TaxID=2849605 RepID=UPI0022A932B2|nr:HTH domain-containing protein [Sporosarcina sp. G11-34]MCZ2259787.1 HTH domain-containing protein [Sporosarcina sp. G11-34]
MANLVVGFIGPGDIVTRIVNQLDPKEMLNVDIKEFNTDTIEEIRMLDNGMLNKCDLLFFAGQLTYDIYFENRLTSRENDDSSLITLRYDGSAVYKTLFDVAMESKGNLSSFTPFTIDILSNSEIQEVLKEVHLLDRDVIKVEGNTSFSTDEWADLHEANYKNGRSKFALTCMASVAKELENRNVPVKRVGPTFASIRAGLELLYANYKVLLSNDLQTTAIKIKWHESDRRSKNRYDFYRKKMEFEKHILDFCEEYKAALTFVNEYEATIYTNKFFMKKYTNNYHCFPLILELEKNMGNIISIGIGVGDETSVAEYNAEKAMKFAESKNGSRAYITFPNGNISGPLQKGDNVPLTFSTLLEDAHLKSISKQTNLSAVTISRILSLLEQNNNDNLTVHQLAEAFDVSARTSSRLLKHLETSGLAKVIGEEQPPGRGRPRKVYKLMILNKVV